MLISDKKNMILLEIFLFMFLYLCITILGREGTPVTHKDTNVPVQPP